MSDHTRADEGEGREPGQIAYEAWVEREWKFCQLVPWPRLSDQAKADWAHIEQKSAAQAEAEVARLAAENQRLRIAFHDATRRPLGVTPDSGAEFYDQRMADKAEERRVARTRQAALREMSRLGDAQRRDHAARTALEVPHEAK